MLDFQRGCFKVYDLNYCTVSKQMHTHDDILDILDISHDPDWIFPHISWYALSTI